MKKTFLLGILALSVIFLVSFVSAVKPVCNDNQGSIWTTKNDCGNVQQDVNQYAIGEKVFINGANFCEESYDWSITHQSGSPPKEVVATGNKAVDSTGNFCFEAYTIQAEDSGEYSVDFGKKNDNYHIDLKAPIVPEFGFVVGGLTLASAVALFFIVRRN